MEKQTSEMMQTDIVAALEGRVALLKQQRTRPDGDDAPCYVELECAEAAAEIKRLRTELATK